MQLDMVPHVWQLLQTALFKHMPDMTLSELCGVLSSLVVCQGTPDKDLKALLKAAQAQILSHGSSDSTTERGVLHMLAGTAA
jgi:hypothetical protein